MSRRNFLAFDLGAESGRAVLGTLENETISIRELHRFPNGPFSLLGHLHWNIYNLFDDIKKGMKTCASEIPAELESLAVDTWGVDFGLLAGDGSILGPPYAYRDPRNIQAMKKFLEIFPKERIYELTGIQFMPFNSLFQLYALVLDNSAFLKAATDLLFMPDLFTYLLTGVKTTETTITSTSQLYNPRLGSWNEELFSALGISRSIMQSPVRPGTVIGPILPGVSQETGLADVPAVATAGHDTGSAVAAVPALGKNWAYISSGTWSLMGIESPQPLITPQTLKLNFTNEGGMEGTTRFLKNVTGLWLVQQCRKKWSADRPLSYDEMRAMAASAPAFKAMIDPDAPDFLNPPDMPAAIQHFCRKTGQAVPSTPGEVLRCAIESLALKYRVVLEELKQVSPHPIEKIHIIGGGSQHVTLCQFTADATSLPVISGPVEATAIGNIMGQALALGYVGSLDEIRAIIANSSELQTYEPRETGLWEAAYARFREILDK
jgi:rhamnulokinase